MPQCAIKNCKSNLGPRSPYYSYFFPKPESSPEQFASWCSHVHPSCIGNKNSRVCSLHFKLEDFDNSDMLKIRLTPNLFKNLTPKLVDGVVPSLNLGDLDEEATAEKGASPKQSRKKKVREADESRPSTSCEEIKVNEGFETTVPPPARNSVGIQCEFGAEVYRGFRVGGETVDK